MAKSSKCKTCGYVFTEQDGSVCPECLTARYDNPSPQASNAQVPTYRRTTTFNPPPMTSFPNMSQQNRPIRKTDSHPMLVFFIIFGIVILGGISSIFSSNHTEDRSANEFVVTTTTTEESKEDIIYADLVFGEPIKDNGLIYTYNSVEDFGSEYNGYTAQSGYHIVSVNFTVKNTSTTNSDFDIYQYLYNDDYYYDILNSTELLNSINALKVGRSTELTSFYEIPDDNDVIYLKHFVSIGYDFNVGVSYDVSLDLSEDLIKQG